MRAVLNRIFDDNKEPLAVFHNRRFVFSGRIKSNSNQLIIGNEYEIGVTFSSTVYSHKEDNSFMTHIYESTGPSNFISFVINEIRGIREDEDWISLACNSLINGELISFILNKPNIEGVTTDDRFINYQSGDKIVGLFKGAINVTKSY